MCVSWLACLIYCGLHPEGISYGRRDSWSSGIGSGLTDQQIAALFRTGASLREQTFWHLLHDTGAAATSALALDAHAVAKAGRPTAAAIAVAGPAGWSGHTAQLLCWLLSGRTLGPLFLTERRAIHRATRADVCPLRDGRRLQ